MTEKMYTLIFDALLYFFYFLLSHEIDIFGLKVVVKSGLGKIILNFTFRVAAAQCKNIGPERLNWPGRLADISEGARSISK